MNTSIQQFEYLLPNPSINWDLMVEFCPELVRLKTTPQDKIYHAEGDVFTHTQMVCNALIQLPEYQQSNKEEQLVLFLSCLLHDIAKSWTTKEENGRITAKGHSGAGSIWVRNFLWRKDFDFNRREQICQVILNHQVPFYLIGKENPDYQIRRLSMDCPLHLLYPVAKADILGRYCQDQQKILDDIDLFKELAIIENCYQQPYSFPDNNTKMKYINSGGKIDPTYPYYAELGSEVLFLCGMPASGKDTFIQKFYPKTPVINFEDILDELDIDYGKNMGTALQLMKERTKELLRKKEFFIWNATHLGKDLRDKNLNLLLDYNAKINVVYLEAPFKEILKRNQERNKTLTNDKIEKMLHKWTLPSNMDGHTVEFKIHLEQDKKYKKSI